MNILCDWDHLVNQEIFQVQEYVLSIACSYDGKLIACAGGDYIIHVFDAKTGNEVHRLCGHIYVVKSINFSGNNKFIVSGGADFSVRIWSLESGNQISDPMIEDTQTVSCVCFSPDGLCLAYCDYDSAVRIQNIVSSKYLSLNGHKGAVLSLDYSPNGKILISGGSDDTIRLWHSITGKQLSYILSKKDSVIYCISFSKNGKSIASAHGDKFIRIWDVHKGRQLNCFSGHTDIVSTVAYSPDGKFLVSGSNDKSIRLWDMINRKSTILKPHLQSVYSVKFSPDGRYIISGGDDGTMRVQKIYY